MPYISFILIAVIIIAFVIAVIVMQKKQSQVEPEADLNGSLSDG